MSVTALDLTDPDSFVGGPPHDFYTYLRNEEPVYWHPSTTLLEPGFWVLTRYADIIATERDVATFSSAADGALMESQEGSGSELMMLNQDPPQHTRLRNLVARGFTPKVIKSMEPHITAAARTIVDRVADERRTSRLRGRLRRRAAARRDRGAARHPLRRPPQGLRLVEPARRSERPGVLRHPGARPDGGDGAVRVRAEPRRRAPRPTARRHRHDARHRRPRRREALRHRVQRVRAPARGRRERDDAQPHLGRDAHADGDTRRARSARRRPRRAPPDRGRRDAAMGHPGAVLPADRDPAGRRSAGSRSRRATR